MSDLMNQWQKDELEKKQQRQLAKLIPVSPNTNIDKLVDGFIRLPHPEREEFIAKIKALLSAAKIEELRLLLSLNNEHITGNDIRERIKELESFQESQ